MNSTGINVPIGLDANMRNRIKVFTKVVYFTPNQVLVNFVAPFKMKMNPNEVM